MSARVAWNLCAGSSIGQCMEMEQLLFAVWLLMIAGGENTGVPRISIERSWMEVGYHCHVNSLARTNHMVPLHHSGANECSSIIGYESWEPKILGEQY